MERNGKSTYTTSQSRKLDLSWMLRKKYIEQNKEVKGSFSWMDGSTTEFESIFTTNAKYLKMKYTVIKRGGEEIYYDYKIYLVTLPSNLGKGEVLYFKCPESGKRARILYLAYGYGKYAHRDWYLEKYGKRLYYGTQLCSNYDYHNTRYHALDSQINDLIDSLFNSKHRKMHYKGKPTKDQQRLSLLESKRLHHDYKRNRALTERLGIII